MINFCEANNLIISNTCFQHSQRHRTTWEQIRIEQETNETKSIRKVLDYITIETKHKHLLQDSRSYQGTLTNSDHRLLITKLTIEWFEVYKKPKKKQRPCEIYNTQLLTHDNNKREEYKRIIEEKLKKDDTQNSWSDIKDIIKSTAKEVVGICKPGFKNHEEYSDKVEQLSKEQKKIRIDISNTKDAEKILDLRKERNRIMKEIKNEIQRIRERNIEEIVKEIDAAPNHMKMYKSIKRLRKPKGKSKNIVIHDNEGKIIINEKEKYQAVKAHFQEQLYDESVKKIEQFIGEPKPLENKITADEVKKAAIRMSNNKATGKDGIPAELLKYGPDTLMEDIARILNSIFEEHSDMINVGRSILQPIPKPGKPEGPRKNLRPINLLNVIRKALSLITLNRIKEKVNKHVQHTQAAYRPNRSTTDIVWAHRFICSKVQLYQNVEIIIVGIDMSSAFDTMERGKLMQELETLLNEDEQRMCRFLLSNTTISIKFGNHDLETVETNIGYPQGDAISGTFSNIEFENALRKLRERMTEARSQDNSEKSSLPTRRVHLNYRSTYMLVHGFTKRPLSLRISFNFGPLSLTFHRPSNCKKHPFY